MYLVLNSGRSWNAATEEGHLKLAIPIDPKGFVMIQMLRGTFQVKTAMRYLRKMENLNIFSKYSTHAVDPISSKSCLFLIVGRRKTLSHYLALLMCLC